MDSPVIEVAGQRVHPVPRFDEVVVNRIAELVRALQTSLPADAKRVVTGTASIAEYAEGDGVLVKVTATIHVADLRSGEIIYSTTAVKNARSATAERAITTAFLQLGRTIGEELAARLP